MAIDPASVRLNVVLVGAGAMGGALLRGWISRRVAPASDIAVIDTAPSEAVEAVCRGAGVALNPAILDDRPVNAVVYAVKPEQLNNVVKAGPRAPDAALRLSVALGRTVASIEAATPAGAPVVRAMPNLPVAIGKGVVGLYAAPGVDAPCRAVAERLMEAVGTVVWVASEAELDALTGVSGSGPAYVFAFVEALAAAGVARGLAPETANLLARRTVVGAAAMLEEAGSEPAALRRAVTSPGGATAQALAALAEGGLDGIVADAVAAAERRAKELSR